MRLIELTMPGGGTVYVNQESVYYVRPAIDSEAPARSAIMFSSGMLHVIEMPERVRELMGDV